MATTKKPQQRKGFRINEYIVYPAHGVGRITSIEEEDNEMDYGSQVVASDNTRQDPREMTSSSVV